MSTIERTEYMRAYRDRHRAALLMQHREYNARMRDAINRKQAKRKALDPLITCRDNQQRRARRQRAPAAPVDTAWLQVLLSDPCAYCGTPSTTVEHIVPLSRGGEDADTNLVGACARCNFSKHTRSLLEFLGT